ncbi:DUF2851 family protein [Pseudozobellia thermophila]|uniref:DUF2851 domain-containing protein n=1 Tax=Pseudozobellia thermophila TaxID=192903 RepID=A0A1M6JZX0_9FLAO|nr:DUF2851 family protein [Pseudozobellia thermophila]SHJ52218.1 Protein of unknown function [Pseudozobellia thermophila]
MREDLLHFIWKYKKLSIGELFSTDGEPIELLDVGTHNHLAGPDFFNAKVSIGGQLWAGNVEIHLRSSDWYAHGHEKDPNYNNVILHVVWEHDTEVFRSDNSPLPSLELKNYISERVLTNYRALFDKRDVSFVNCERNLAQVDSFVMGAWLERLYFERLERKSNGVAALLAASNNDWEEVLFKLLLRSFGSKINADAFKGLGEALEFKVVRKLRPDLMKLESVLLGMAHLLSDETVHDGYYIGLKQEFEYQKSKFGLENEAVRRPSFFKLRPANFPTLRLSQLANLYHAHETLFAKVVGSSHVNELYRLFDVGASPYWQNHFSFGKPSKNSAKRLTKKFIDLLILNTVLPLKFCHARKIGMAVHEEILGIIAGLAAEENSIISNFKKQGVSVKNGMESQSLLQLYDYYCTKNKCLQCRIGASLLH